MVSCEMSCHVIPFDAMGCHVKCSHVMSVLRSATKYCKYYRELQSTTPVLLCTAKDYSVLQSITPVKLCTTKENFQTTAKYYTPYYKVLHATTAYYKVVNCTTMYYNVPHVPRPRPPRP